MDHHPGSDEPRLPISKAILAVLDRHAVPERQRLATLQAAVEMSYQQVRRRMSGESPWNVDEIKLLASHFGEPLFGLLATMVDDVGQHATLHLGGSTLPCTIWLGPPARSKSAVGRLVAVPGDAADHWLVVLPADVGERKAFEIRRLIFEAASPRRIAVRIGGRELSASTVQFLRDKGLDAIEYRNIEVLRATLDTARFDGFILDWSQDGNSIRELLPGLRARHPTVPVIILAGHDGKPNATQDAELERTLVTYRAQLYEKTTRPLSLLTALELGFEHL